MNKERAWKEHIDTCATEIKTEDNYCMKCGRIPKGLENGKKL